ncbi:Ca2+-binding RTX toxin-like protein [Actinoplanes campanulatus]|uniref:Ca2+-binding RTX toxin-like protein n=1 Tax=Actinoplanes campanulatus TaxID=113559 RepID=A0A7W5ALX6_9ACTN|nr:hypothetical protein [Actinoplanes campanulatus]MBB3098219.1 Ca2+-binding RTX toxin-like protein [Actinoplanes campanulatus]GGN34901.1 hypothetical protein GCM10010109_58370 [Actinoplanes campanulatus]GID38823.1 hypothetical protein Aca09nite_53290 [Actinoplanes campanulatus]
MPRTTWLSRVGTVLAGSTAVVGVFAAPAQAATTGKVYVQYAEPGDPGQIVYEAGPGRRNAVVVTRSGRTVTIDDRVTVRAGKGCRAVKGDKTKVRCTPKAFQGVTVFLGSGDDRVTNRGNVPLLALGGSGKDTLIGGSGSDMLMGGTGADRLYGQGGADNLYGESGYDLLVAGTGDDRLYGGTGNDREYGGDGNDLHIQGRDTTASDADWLSAGNGTDSVYYTYRTKGVSADSDGVRGDDGRSGEGDTIISAETLYGGDGDDRLHGTSGADTLIGFGGADQIYGRGGDDHLDAGHDEKVDLLDGGDNGTAGDTCVAPGDDDTRVNCER